ncbi:MAG: fumarylacetoacetase [Burkholderiales bacterium]|nr:fumarylacetoacetase [Burkholderiales bacterium]
MIAYGIFSSTDDHTPRVCAKIGSNIIDLNQLCELGILNKVNQQYFMQDSLNEFIRQGYGFRKGVKHAVEGVLATIDKHPHSEQVNAVFAANQVKLYMPVKVGGYTDFYASKQHATNIGKIFRPDNPLMPNWVHMPIAYNGRASSVVASGHGVKRPQGQILVDGKPQFEYCKKLDFEVELGIIIGQDSVLGEPITIENAKEHIFGVCIVNDWSARDIQAWEYQPLGPFNSKSFLTSISSFIIPIEELDSYKIPAQTQDPTPLPYLVEKTPHSYDIRLEVKLATAKYPEGIVVGCSNFKDIYWTMNQWITQHTVTGCNLKVGDLLASGTISGNDSSSLGSLMELTINGKSSIQLPNGEMRTFLEDGDSVIITGFCGSEVIGEVTGTIGI